MEISWSWEELAKPPTAMKSGRILLSLLTALVLLALLAACKPAADKSAAGLTELNVQGKQNLEAIVASAAAAQKGAEALSQQALGFAKSSWEDGVAASKELSTARSVQEFFELQTAWAKKSMERYVAELTKTNEIVTATVKDSIKPINERVTASVETFQAAR